MLLLSVVVAAVVVVEMLTLLPLEYEKKCSKYGNSLSLTHSVDRAKMRILENLDLEKVTSKVFKLRGSSE